MVEKIILSILDPDDLKDFLNINDPMKKLILWCVEEMKIPLTVINCDVCFGYIDYLTIDGYIFDDVERITKHINKFWIFHPDKSNINVSLFNTASMINKSYKEIMFQTCDDTKLNDKLGNISNLKDFRKEK